MATNPLLVLDANQQPQVAPSVSSNWTFDIGTAQRFIAQRDVVEMSYMEGGPANELVPYVDLSLLQSTYDPENLSILGSDLAAYLKTPSNDLNVRGAYRIFVIRVGQPTGASLTLANVSAQPVLLLTAVDQGTYTNKISVEVASGTVVGKRVTVRFRQETTVLDNLQNALHVAYTGNAGTATLTITRTGAGPTAGATRLQTTLSGATDGSIPLDLDLTQDTFATVQQLATYINGQNGYRATADAYGDPLLPSAELDAVSGANIRTSVALVIRYIGAGTSATLATTATTLTTTVTGATGHNLSLDLTAAGTNTLGEVVALINGMTGIYTCTLGPNADPNALTNGLFAIVGSQDIRSASFSLTAQPGRMDYVSQAGLGSIVFAVNTHVARLTATRVGTAATVPANVAQTFLLGGTNPVPTVQDWFNALTVIEQEDLIGALMLPVSTDPVIQDALTAWATSMYTQSGKNFRPFLAPPDFTSVADAKSLALGFNSTLDGFMFQSVVASSGVTEQPPLYPVAMYCGAAAGALPTQSTTRVVLRCRALPSRAKVSKAMKDDLLSSGITVLEEVKGVGLRIAMGVTTSLSQDRIDRMLSESMARDVIQQRIVAYVQPLIPHWAMQDFMPTVKGQVYNALISLQTDGLITTGMDATGKILPAWLPIQVSIQAGVMKIQVHVLIGGEIDHIMVLGTIGYQLFDITLPASV